MSDNTWENYYQKIKGRATRPLLLDALKHYPSGESLHAIDLGCGDGTESALLLERGWHVLAIDGESAAIGHLLRKIPAENRSRLETQVARFEDVTFPAADLVH